ncbi:MAG: hypothetical protein PHT13_06075, partial [Methanosarcina sp.]|nr:hypothetical protein [Methanosarcina sp.]
RRSSDLKSGYLVFGTAGNAEKMEVTSSIQGIISRRRAHDSKNNMYLISETGKRLRFLEYIERTTLIRKEFSKGLTFQNPLTARSLKPNGTASCWKAVFPVEQRSNSATIYRTNLWVKTN